MAIRTNALTGMSFEDPESHEKGSVHIEYDWNDAEDVFKRDADGTDVPVVEERTIIGLRVVNNIPRKHGEERLVTFNIVPLVGRDAGKILRRRVTRGITDVRRLGRDVTKIKDVKTFSLDLVHR